MWRMFVSGILKGRVITTEQGVTGLSDAGRRDGSRSLVKDFVFMWSHRVSLLGALAFQTSHAQGEMASGKVSIISLITGDCREEQL